MSTPSTGEFVEQADNVMPVYSKNLGLRPYTVNPASPEAKEEWKRNILQIFETLKSNDEGRIRDIILREGWKPKNHGSSFGKSYGDKIMKVLHEEQFDDEELLLLAIGLWYLRDKGPWHGTGPGEVIAATKLLIGGTHDMESFMGDSGQQPSCLDTSIIINDITAEMGLHGNIYTIGKGNLNHRLWMDDKGRILDPMWGWKKGGFFRSDAEFRKHINKRPSIMNLHNMNKPLYREID